MNGTHYPPKTPRQPLNWKRLMIIFLVWAAALYFFMPANQKASLQLPYSDFKKRVAQGDVLKVTAKGEELTGPVQETP